MIVCQMTVSSDCVLSGKVNDLYAKSLVDQ